MGRKTRLSARKTVIMKNKLGKFAFYWGSVFGCAVFLLNVLFSVFTHGGSFLQKLLYSLLVVFGLVFSVVKFRAANPERLAKFSSALGLLTLVSLVMSLFYTLYSAVLIFKIEPTMLQDAMNQVIAQSGDDELYSLLLDNDSIFAITQVAFLFANFFIDFLGNFFYALLIALIFTRNSAGGADFNLRRYDQGESQKPEQDAKIDPRQDAEEK